MSYSVNFTDEANKGNITVEDGAINTETSVNLPGRLTTDYGRAVNENFLHLQRELAAIEDKVAYARQYYNDSVLSLENASQRFPGVLFFSMYGRKRKEYLKIPSEARAMPSIDL